MHILFCEYLIILPRHLITNNSPVSNIVRLTRKCPSISSKIGVEKSYDEEVISQYFIIDAFSYAPAFRNNLYDYTVTAFSISHNAFYSQFYCTINHVEMLLFLSFAKI